MDKLDNNFDTRPWGCFEVIDIGPNFQVKRITVLPGKRLSLQSHKHRKEHWIVANGDAEVEIDGEIKNLKISGEIGAAPDTALSIFNNPSFFLNDLKAIICARKFVMFATKSFGFSNLLLAVMFPK